ncbi:MAG: Transcriptional regulator, tetR family [Actinoallomurus sp.]|jgi:AcrR family transcriptional regulator|nr:Transcriptional regulator, tetR family [Actinoallomurus sp.]
MNDGPLPDASAAPGPGRRRGAALTRAIYLATLAELAEKSFEELSFDKIATRAEAGKASLYRRWPTPAALLLEALADPSVGFSEPAFPDTGSLKSDLMATLTDFARALDQPHGQALRPLMTRRPRHPELFDEVQRMVVRPRVDVLTAILRAGADRGEVAPDAVTARIAGVGLQLLVSRHMAGGTIPEREIEAIVCEVLLPLTAPRGGTHH